MPIEQQIDPEPVEVTSNFYSITPGEYPYGVPFRSLSTHPLLGGTEVIEVQGTIDGVDSCALDSIEVTHLGDLTGCIAVWQTLDEPVDDVDAYQAAVDEAAVRFIHTPAMRDQIADAQQAVLVPILKPIRVDTIGGVTRG